MYDILPPDSIEQMISETITVIVDLSHDHISID